MTLSEWMQKLDRSQSEVARTLGTTRQAVQGWCSGAVRPSLYHATAIAAMTSGDVAPQEWLTQTERLAIAALFLTADKVS
jgi:DNA-binding transcriptional regulator YdaS (Cro superfamily)